MNKLKRICLYTVFLSSTLCITLHNPLADIIKKIKIHGNHRVEEETILNYLKLKIGENIDIDKQNKGIKNLFETQLFENIKIDLDNNILHVFVEEFPLIAKVKFANNQKIKDSTLKNELVTKPGYTLSKSNINSDIIKIKEMYKAHGKFLLDINVKIERLKNNRAKVIFEINEGPQTEIKNIYFIGNQNYKSSELKSILMSKEKLWFAFWENNAYDVNKIEYDKQLLNLFYHSLGYADFNVISVIPQISKNKEYFDIVYVIEEGAKYKIRNIEIENNISTVNKNELKKLVKVYPGNTYNSNHLNNISNDIINYLGNNGYSEIEVIPRIKEKNTKQKFVDINFVISKAQRSYINKINIFGNVKTRDKVIRNRFSISEGDLYQKDQINNAKRHLLGLDYFESIVITKVPTNISYHDDLNILVQEKSTANISLQGGYASNEGLSIGAHYNERNFLGTGKLLKAEITKSKNNLISTFGVTEPYFLDRNLALGWQIFLINTGASEGAFGSSYQPYSVNSYGTKFKFSYEIKKDLSHQVYYLYKHEKITVKDEKTTSKYLKEQAGEYDLSSIGQSFTYDLLDNAAFPKNGCMINLSQEYTGLGGNVKFLKHEADFNAYRSFYDNNYTIKFLSSAGHINGILGHPTRIRDRFNMGDPTFRGYESSGMGPRIITDKDLGGDALGGKFFYKFTTEFSFPITKTKELNAIGNLFADYGAIWDADIQDKKNIYDSKKPYLTLGVGVLLVTRIAPIRIDYTLFRKGNSKYDKPQTIHLRFSTSF